MIDAIFLFLAKVVTVFLYIVTMLSPIVITAAFGYAFYKDYLCSPNKANKTRDKTSA